MPAIRSRALRRLARPAQPPRTPTSAWNTTPSRSAKFRKDSASQRPTRASPSDFHKAFAGFSPATTHSGAPKSIVTQESHDDPSLPSSGPTGGKQFFALQNLIRYGNDKTLLKPPTLEEKLQMATAEKFFEHGSGDRLLYSAEANFHHTTNHHIPEVVVLGASNVGKSSFLNALLGKPGAARVSQKPGRTKLLNAFGAGPPAKMAPGLVRKGETPPQHSLVVMDTPGYGYRSQTGWGDAIIKYIQTRKMLRGAILLLSSDKKLMAHDKWLLKTLAENDTRTLVILTKADKGRKVHNGRKDWATTCSTLGDEVRSEMRKLEKKLGSGWKEGSGWVSDVYITAANMDLRGKLGNGGGMGGARLAILEMAGFSAQQTVEKKAETETYTGQIVPFDDIVWKT